MFEILQILPITVSKTYDNLLIYNDYIIQLYDRRQHTISSNYLQLEIIPKISESVDGVVRPRGENENGYEGTNCN